MIKLPKNYFSNLSVSQYREQLKLLPKLKDERVQLYTMLAFTLAALSFFGIFAINPTLSTIVELRRQFDDLQFVHEKLIEKNQNLSTLQHAFLSLSNDLPVVYDALPQNAEVPKFMGQMNALIRDSRLQVKTLQTYGVEVTPDKKLPKNGASFTFALEAEGSYEDIIAFIQRLTGINRLVSVEMVSIARDEKNNVLILNLQGRQYFKP